MYVLDKLVEFSIQKYLGPLLSGDDVQVRCKTAYTHRTCDTDNTKMRCLEFEIRNVTLSAEELTNRLRNALQHSSNDNTMSFHTNIVRASIQCIVIHVIVPSLSMTSIIGSNLLFRGFSGRKHGNNNGESSSDGPSPLEVEVKGLHVSLASISNDDSATATAPTVAASSSESELNNFQKNGSILFEGLEKQGEEVEIEREIQEPVVEAGWIAQWMNYALSLLTVRVTDTQICVLDSALSSRPETVQCNIHKIFYGPEMITEEPSLSTSDLFNQIIQISGITLSALSFGPVQQTYSNIVDIPGTIQAIIRTSHSDGNGHQVENAESCTDIEIYTETIDISTCPESIFVIARVLASHFSSETFNECELNDKIPTATFENSYPSSLENVESLARKNLFVGGILLRNSSLENDESLLEAFYDATDKSMSKYMSFVHSIKNGNTLSLRFHVSKLQFQLTANTAKDEKIFSSIITDTHISANISQTRKWIQIELSDVATNATIASEGKHNFSPLRFPSPAESSDCVISASNVLLTFVETKRLRRNEKDSTISNIEVELALEPIEITLHLDFIRDIADICRRCSTSYRGRGEKSTFNKQDNIPSISFNSHCANITVFVPIMDTSMKKSALRSKLLLRKGVEVLQPFTSLGISFNTLLFESSSFDFERTSITAESGKVFIVTDPIGSLQTSIRERVDLIEFFSEPELEIESTVQIRGLSSEEVTSTYPTIPSLVNNDGKSNNFSGIRSKRPQENMLQNAIKCNHSIEVSFPTCIIDISLDERKYLESVLDSIMKSDHNELPMNSDSSENANCGKFGLAFHCQQLIVFLHEATYESQTETNSTSFVGISDTLRSHFCFSTDGLEQARVTSHDSTLYEAQYANSRNNGDRQKANYHDLKHRGFTCLKNATPILYRTHANASNVIVKKPSLHIDISQEKSIDEVSFRVFIYDITYRYDLKSEWFWKLQSIVQGVPLGQNDKHEQMDQSDSNQNEDLSEDCKVTKLFITIWDAVIDYATPDDFVACRSVLHVGELHISSHMVQESPMFSFKVCLSDITGFLSDQRLAYDDENRRLSCSLALLDRPPECDKGYSSPRVPSIQEAFVSKGFVRVVSFDTIDSFIKLNKAAISNAEPRIDLNLYLGLLTINTCNDSFKLLTSVFGEWWTEFSSPSEMELERIKVESSFNDFCETGLEAGGEIYTDNVLEASISNVKSCQVQETNALESLPDSELSASELRKKYHVESDAKTSDLAKSLLIHDYYTLETTDSQNNSTLDETPLESKDLADFLVDEWASIEHDWLLHEFGPNQDERAMWFPTIQPNCDPLRESSRPLQIFPSHVPLSCAICDPLGQGDMNAALHAGLEIPPSVNMRLVVHDMSVCLRFFEGNDFVQCYNSRKQRFTPRSRNKDNSRKQELLGALLETEYLSHADSSYTPMIEDEFCNISVPKHARNHSQYFEVMLDRVRLRLDSFIDTPDHRLTSCLDLKVTTLFLSETISRGYPKKMLGEWINDYEHPRDNNDGVLMLKMVSMQPLKRLSRDGKLMADESRVALQLLPLRINLDQHALTFIKNFFSSDNASSSNTDSEMGTFFQVFDVKECKLKVNYQPIGVDYNALKNGSYLELLNLFPLEDMDLLLKNLSLKGISGWGNVISDILRYWVEDISSTQIHKFVTRAAPVNVFTNIGAGAVNLVMLPVDQYKKERKFGRGVRKGASSFAKTVALETLNATSKISKHVAKALDTPKLLPRRPGVPRNVREASAHSRSSVSQGLEVAAQTIIAVPIREYNSSGPSGAVKGVIKAIPIAVMAPLSGASEALSYTLLGARNQMRPDLYKEEEEMERRQYGFR